MHKIYLSSANIINIIRIAQFMPEKLNKYISINKLLFLSAQRTGIKQAVGRRDCSLCVSAISISAVAEIDGKG